MSFKRTGPIIATDNIRYKSQNFDGVFRTGKHSVAPTCFYGSYQSSTRV